MPEGRAKVCSVTDRNTVEKYEDCVGEWWNADNPSQRWPGVLRRDTAIGWWELTLSHEGEASGQWAHGVALSGETFYGATSAGAVTLLAANKSSESSRQATGPLKTVKYTSEVWHAFDAFLGGHVAHDTRWDSIDVDVPLAWEWFSPTVLEPGRGDHPDRRRRQPRKTHFQGRVRSMGDIATTHALELPLELLVWDTCEQPLVGGGECHSRNST